ncbi:hypothetical protein U0070_016260 [Myodes glareolus]|uniref:Uncharacterized protein n=1 Tax=Myodes glareolus TaxID=447135 RepID=A0AAW0HDR3_MYOGA
MRIFYHHHECAVVPTESPGQPHLFYLTPGTKENGRLKSTFNSKESYNTLNIRDAQLEDLRTYLCAVEAQCFLQACSLVTNCR